MDLQQRYEYAAKLYDDMKEAYRFLMDNPEDRRDIQQLLSAALSLCYLDLPNPFADLSGKSFQVNAAIKPSEHNRIITAVFEQ